MFAVASDVQIWCRLADNVDSAPGAYVVEGGLEVPVSARLVAQHYLAIDGVRTPVKLLWSDGSTVVINRSHE